MSRIIRKPLLTEKNTAHGESGVYAFEVQLDADKTEIRKAIEKVFQVKVSSVRTLVCRDRAKRTAKSVSGVKYWKKALVKLQPGQKINLFEGA